MAASGTVIKLSGWRQSAVLALLSLFAFLPGIASLPPLDRDESRFVQATKQMLQSGDFIDIRFQDEHRYKKPAGIYWYQSAIVTLTGQGTEAGIWAYRVTSALAGLAAVLLIASLGEFLFGPAAGLAAGLMLAGLFGLGFEARIAKTDATLLAITLLAQAALARLYIGAKEQRAISPHWRWAFWCAQGVGILIKGPLTPLVCLLTIAVVVLVDRDRSWLKRLKPVSGLLLTTLIVLPWFVAISLKSGGAFWAESVGKDMLGKVASGAESHGAPPGYYVLTYSLYMWPFGLLALQGGLKALNRFREPKLLFCLAWYVPFWLVLELTPTKLPHYPLPAYPPLILLGAWALFTISGRGTALKRWQVWLWWLTLAGVGIVTLSFAAIASGAQTYLTGAVSLSGIFAAAFALAAGWLASGLRTDRPLLRISGAALAAMLFTGLLASSLAPGLKPIWLSPAIADAFNRGKNCNTSVLAAVDYHEPSLVFLTGTSTRLTGLEGAAALLSAPDGCGVALIPAAAKAQLAGMLPSGLLLQDIAPIEGFSYSNGKPQSLLLVKAGR